MTTVRELFEDVDRQILRDLELDGVYWTGRRAGFRNGFFTATLIGACLFGAAWVWLR